MCGITGIVNYKKDISEEKPILQIMTQSLAKRGPDDSGCFVSTHALLGHRRLIVIDPMGGAQPMQKTVDGNTYTIVYNGELYNTEEVRAKLFELGASFDSYSDTEVLLRAYIAWGPECTRHINGIFGFGVWDENNETLFLCRDPLGVKPLYYTVQDDTLIFGSEIKAILKYPSVEPVIDENGICEIMGLGPAHAQGSGVFKNIQQIPAAHYLLHTRGQTKLHEYWTLEAQAHTENEQETSEHVRFLLLDAIKRQLVADVPVCTFLSGGLDSSIISAVTAKEFEKEGRTLDTFSIEYEGNREYYQASDFQPTADDAWVDLMSGHIGSRHHRVILDNRELVAALDDAVQANDMPGMADIDASLLLFCREVRKKATVALSGECADEIFGGYPWYWREDMAYADTFPWSGAVKERQALLSPGLRHISLSDYVQAQYEETVARVPAGPDMAEEERRLKKLFYLNVKWFMNTLLTRKDRMSMATSLEVRVPFADYRLVQYAFNIPRDFLFYGSREKGLLRKALNGILPQEILWRKKSPYPKTFNPVYTFGVRNWMNDILHDPASPVLQIIDRETVQKIVDTEGRSFTRPWFGQLMTGPQLIAYMIQIDLWMRKYRVRLSV
ncbi:MAG: asparagine synthase (glutamine-hydrolyzing) [Bacillota bacterium]